MPLNLTLTHYHLQLCLNWGRQQQMSAELMLISFCFVANCKSQIPRLPCKFCAIRPRCVLICFPQKWCHLLTHARRASALFNATFEIKMILFSNFSNPLRITDCNFWMEFRFLHTLFLLVQNNVWCWINLYNNTIWCNILGIFIAHCGAKNL